MPSYRYVQGWKVVEVDFRLVGLEGDGLMVVAEGWGEMHHWRIRWGRG